MHGVLQVFVHPPTGRSAFASLALLPTSCPELETDGAYRFWTQDTAQQFTPSTVKATAAVNIAKMRKVRHSAVLDIRNSKKASLLHCQNAESPAFCCSGHSELQKGFYFALSILLYLQRANTCKMT